MPTTKFHSANLTLDVLRDECQTLQEHDITKLVHLQAATVQNPVNDQTKFNQAQYVSVGGFSQVPELTFVPAAENANVSTIISNALAQGGQLIFDEIVFIQNQEQRVLGFGKL